MSAPPLRHLYARLTSFSSLQAATHRNHNQPVNANNNNNVGVPVLCLPRV